MTTASTYTECRFCGSTNLGAVLCDPPSPHYARVFCSACKRTQGYDQAPMTPERAAAFVMPGGTELAARLHLARTVCRRAERLMVAINHREPLNPQTIIYINRLSDLLFAMARRANKEAGVGDVKWSPRKL